MAICQNRSLVPFASSECKISFKHAFHLCYIILKILSSLLIKVLSVDLVVSVTFSMLTSLEVLLLLVLESTRVLV